LQGVAASRVVRHLYGGKPGRLMGAEGNMAIPDGKERSSLLSLLGLKRLNEQQIRQIDTALESVGDYGEVHLIVRHGELKYINRVESHRAWDSYNGSKPGG
jgi:hypothetical protein